MKHYGKDKPYIGDEDQLQKVTNRIFAFDYPAIYPHAFHVPNGGKRPTITVHRRGKTYRYSAAGKKLKEMGTKPGVSDWIILYPTERYHGACIELKTKGGSLQETQREFLERMEKQGYFTAVAWSLDGFEEAVSDFLREG